MDERTPLERAQIAALTWSLAKHHGDDRLARVALADYRGALQLLKLSEPELTYADPFDYYARLRRMASETQMEPGLPSQAKAPAPPAVAVQHRAGWS
jgi:hypothetical protein